MDVEKIFLETLKPSLGCTELAAVAFAVAAAVQATARWSPERPKMALVRPKGEDVECIHVRVNRNIFKNTFSIYIPNTDGHKGIVMVAALGLFCDPNGRLELFQTLRRQDVETAQQLIGEGKVTVAIVDAEQTDLYVYASVGLRKGSQVCTGASLVQDAHTNLLLLERGGEIFYRRGLRGEPASSDQDMEELKRSSFQDLIRAVEDLPPSVVALLRKTIGLNKKAAEVGLAQPLGLGIGFHQSHDEGSLDMIHYVSSVAAAGSDARMSGYSLEVMSSAGSGNQGIVATMPVVVYCEYCDVEEDRLLRALALSHLVTMYVTTHVGALSALCGAAIKAGIGAACGLTYAMGGEVADICRAVKIAVASISGMVCDGAKPSCALKVSLSSEMALRAASLAMKKVQVSDADGIVASTAEETIRNLARLERSMTAVDDEIVQIMEQKFRRHGK